MLKVSQNQVGQLFTINYTIGIYGKENLVSYIKIDM